MLSLRSKGVSFSVFIFWEYMYKMILTTSIQLSMERYSVSSDGEVYGTCFCLVRKAFVHHFLHATETSLLFALYEFGLVYVFQSSPPLRTCIHSHCHSRVFSFPVLFYFLWFFFLDATIRSLLDGEFSSLYITWRQQNQCIRFVYSSSGCCEGTP